MEASTDSYGENDAASPAIQLRNWKNFRNVDLKVGPRLFLVGPNASGKSNFLDAIRFLRDLVLPGGGLHSACDARGGVSKIRCLSAAEVHLASALWLKCRSAKTHGRISWNSLKNRAENACR